MFPFGPASPGGDRAAGAGAEEPAPHARQGGAARPLPSPPPSLQPGADAAPPPSPCGSPRRPCAPSQPQAGRAGELRPAGALESSAASAQGEQSPPSPPRRQPGPDCRAGSRGRHCLSARLGGPGARLFGWLRERSLGRGLFVDPARDNFRTMTNLYGSIHPADSVYLSTRTHGAVFNLEYSPDGCTEDGCPHKKFFHTRFLMRMRLTPDCSKMLISTSSGYLLILHDLDLTKSLEVGSYPILRARRTTSSSDLTTLSSSSGPRVSGSPSHHSDSSSSSEKHMSRASQREGISPRNSLEVLTPEVPGERDRGNCITSLQLHPKGWATLLRCSSNTDDQEWTCVYEFQEGAPVRPVSPRCSLRLTHYIEEANVGRGYIKELCFSPDGRMISSPHGYGIRLLGFDKQCSELIDCLPKEASPLRVIRSLYSHNDVVLTTKFSPTHCQIASGCLSGRVSLYQPKF
ncbi:DDB1- and CUL4-associated factor 10 isoform X3 [Eubalaena glacialis]|uniref:DDB1- and CUL4-associated factor 10 isoform X3 n=1 Tax=Eubalaena glacialis TaxID=27606 RepID=UPI002A59F8A1|nr:DDB1- and CUL4-associated factor 10 isoform X3 [Eubalaena glacialis]